jgi:hypothetical protein
MARSVYKLRSDSAAMSHLQKIDNELRKCNERLSSLLSTRAETVVLTPFSLEFQHYCHSIVQIARQKKRTFSISISMPSDSIMVVDFGTENTRYIMTLTKYNKYISETYYVLNRVSGNRSEKTYNYDNEIDAAGNVDRSISSACGLSFDDKAESEACLLVLMSK